MIRTVRFRVGAELDLVDAYGWYEGIRRGLGADFLICIEEALDRIREFPKSYPVVYEDVRRALIRRFPYGVFYVLDEEAIVVMAVFHSGRDPNQWQSRT